MKGSLLVGTGREIRRVPADEFEQSIAGLPASMRKRLAFMTREHHRVRDYAVRELPLHRRPLAPRVIAHGTGLSESKTVALLSELEKALFFLVRDARGSVNWAFPVTCVETPHRLSFSTGESSFGA